MNTVAIHGAPRSGTSWLGEIFNSSPSVAYRYQPLFSYAFKGRLSNQSSREDVSQFFDDLKKTEDPFVLQTGKARLARRELAFPKSEITHLVYKEVRYHNLLHMLMERQPTLRLIAIIRDPAEVLASWLNAPREFQPEWNFSDEWRYAPLKNQGRPEEFYGYEGWKNSAQTFQDLHRRCSDRVRILRYSDLVRAPSAQAKRLFEFCSLPFDSQVEDFIRFSTSGNDADPYGIRRPAQYRGFSDTIDEEIKSWVYADAAAAGLEEYLE